MEARAGSSPAPAVEVDPWVDRIGGWIERHQRLAIKLGNIESGISRDRLRSMEINRPVYIAGLARSGSTILLELLGRHPEMATHRYRDFPGLFTPIFWNWFIDRAASASQEAKERAHRDRIKVTPESPEAFDEVLWMAFFPQLHERGGNAVLDGETSSPAFETFYRDHIRKVLLLRGGTRYLAKANYNATRLPYLSKLFPDARFIVPVRDPVWHVASLMKQHELFCREGERDPRVTRHLSRSGHFEFGLDRRAPVIGSPARAAEIEGLWREGNEAAGWALLWAATCGHVLSVLDAVPALKQAVMIVRYEDLCATPLATMSAILDHCGLLPEGIPEEAARQISAPDYYRPGFTDEQIRAIRERTASVAQSLGY